jgi:hypothetical protein
MMENYGIKITERQRYLVEKIEEAFRNEGLSEFDDGTNLKLYLTEDEGGMVHLCIADGDQEKEGKMFPFMNEAEYEEEC